MKMGGPKGHPEDATAHCHGSTHEKSPECETLHYNAPFAA